jgi:hypothetical protein
MNFRRLWTAVPWRKIGLVALIISAVTSGIVGFAYHFLIDELKRYGSESSSSLAIDQITKKEARMSNLSFQINKVALDRKNEIAFNRVQDFNRAPEPAKEWIQSQLDEFLRESDNVVLLPTKTPGIYWNAWFSEADGLQSNVVALGQFYTLNLDISAFSYSALRSDVPSSPLSAMADPAVGNSLSSSTAKSTRLTIKPVVSDASGVVIDAPNNDMLVDLRKLRNPEMKAVGRYVNAKEPMHVPEELRAGKMSFTVRTRSPGCASIYFAIFEDIRPLDHLVLRVVTKDEKGKLPLCAANSMAKLTGGLDGLRDAALGMESEAEHLVGDAALYVFDADGLHSNAVFVDGRKGVAKSIYGWETDGSVVDYLRRQAFEAIVAQAQHDAAGNVDGAYVAAARELWKVLFTASDASRTQDEAKGAGQALQQLVKDSTSTPVIVVRIASSLRNGATRSLFAPLGILGASGKDAVLDKPMIVIQPMARERFVGNGQCIGDWTLALPDTLEAVPQKMLDVEHMPSPLPGKRIRDIATLTTYLESGDAPTAPASGLVVLAHQNDGALWFEANTNRIIKQSIGRNFSPGSVGILSACSVVAPTNRNVELLEKLNQQGLDTLIASPFNLDPSYGAKFSYSFAEVVQEAVGKEQPTILELFNRAIARTGEKFMKSNVGNYKELGLEYVLLGHPTIRLCKGQPSAH